MSFIICITKCDQNNQVKKDELGGPCNIHGRNENCIHKFGRKPWREKSTGNTKPREKGNILKIGYSMELVCLHRSTSDFFSGVFKT
jgi:hypothetical protein